MTLTATPVAGYRFDHWIIDENASADLNAAASHTDVENPVIEVTVTANATYTALFTSQLMQQLYLPIGAGAMTIG
ncbi:MAG: hypothetical protein R2932_25190 [Caldilineaceae bacterium]